MCDIDKHYHDAMSFHYRVPLPRVFIIIMYGVVCPGGGGGYSPQILVGMCRGKVKNGPGLRNELQVERENAGLRNELEPF